MIELLYGELKKIFFRKSTVIVIILMLLLAVIGTILFNYKYTFTYGDGYREVCDKYGGKMTEEKEKELRNLADMWLDPMLIEIIYARYILEQLDQINNRKDYVEFIRSQGKELEQYGLKNNDKHIANKGKLVQALYKNEKSPVFVNNIEYVCILNLGILYLLFLLGIVFLVGNSFSMESTYNMFEILNATPNGRIKLRCAKILAVFCFVLLLNVLFFGFLIIMLKCFGYEIQNLNAPLYMLKGFEKTASSMTIGKFFMYSVLAQVVLSLIWAAVMMFFSKITDSFIASIVMGVICILASSYFEINYFLKNIGWIRDFRDYSLQELSFIKYQKAFNPMAYLNPAYYFEMPRYGEIAGHLLKIYYFPIITSIIIVIILGAYLILGEKNILNRRSRKDGTFNKGI